MNIDELNSKMLVIQGQHALVQRQITQLYSLINNLINELALLNQIDPMENS